MKKSKEYLKEYKKSNAIEDLNEIKIVADRLIRLFEKRKNMDNGSKQNIILIKETVSNIYSQELAKELTKQKKEGKQFLSDDDVDRIVDDILREEGLK